ncbi:hypothetical protein C8R45DRAFT_955681 [Mycena sanguinolenta]|nr:hypothetical protein C8R45DRAFT_955681 [Mycena sanguinolenta]
MTAHALEPADSPTHLSPPVRRTPHSPGSWLFVHRHLPTSPVEALKYRSPRALVYAASTITAELRRPRRSFRGAAGVGSNVDAVSGAGGPCARRMGGRDAWYAVFYLQSTHKTMIILDGQIWLDRRERRVLERQVQRESGPPTRELKLYCTYIAISSAVYISKIAGEYN